MYNNIPPKKDLENRWKRLQEKMRANGTEACLVCSNVHLYYLTGTVFSGYFYIGRQGDPLCFLKRQSPFREDIASVSIRKPEDIPSVLEKQSLPMPAGLSLEGDQITYNEFLRLQKIFPGEVKADATAMLRSLRMIKTPWEIEQLRYSARKHAEVYALVPACFERGMTDVAFQTKLETLTRVHGSIGIFRGFGSNMEIHMGSILVGDNAASVSPYDFALGGAGMHPSAPIGANGSVMKEGSTVMVDMAGNYTAYISDMTRTFAIGRLPEIAYRAHQLSIDIQDRVMEVARPGSSCAELYQLSLSMVQDAGLEAFFMGTDFQAKFVGHGLGIEINEPPVLTPRSKEALEEGMTFALEPKFVLPGIGAVGVENTFLVKQDGLEKLTLQAEEIISLS